MRKKVKDKLTIPEEAEVRIDARVDLAKEIMEKEWSLIMQMKSTQITWDQFVDNRKNFFKQYGVE